MKKQILVIGLGQFGMSLARSLTDMGTEVFAVDKTEARVASAAEFVAEAVAFDATNEAALARTAPDRRDICVCAIGDDSREGSIITTALLRQMGAKHIVARAADPLHERILGLIGAHEVINPERAFGERYASGLAHQGGVLGEFPLAGGMSLVELRLPESLVGRTLAELELPRKHGATVIAVQRGPETLPAPDPTAPLQTGDVLVVVSTHRSVVELAKKLG